MKNSLIFLFFTFAGIVTGSLVSVLTAKVNALSWLSYGLKFGLTHPFVLDLRVLQLSLALSFNLNICVIIFVTIAIIIAYNVTGRRRRR